ncbi:MAG: hypothetical protein ACOYNN_04205 [Terrimicrobiaceae bacterium]
MNRLLPSILLFLSVLSAAAQQSIRVDNATKVITDPSGVLAANAIPTTSGNNTFTGNNTFSGNVTAGNLTVNGTTTFGNATQARGALGLGTLATQNGTFSGTSSGNNTGDQTLAGLGGVASTNGTATNLTVNGTLTANGSALTSLNGTQITSGTINSARLPDAGLGAGAWGGAGRFVQIQTDDKGRVIFASEGNLGSLASQNGTYGNATELTTGTLAAARLPNLTLNLSGTLHNTPVTFSSGVGNATLANQTANTVFAGPSSGNATTPTFRALTNADIPSSLALSGNLSNNGTATFGDAAADEFSATDDDPRFPNLTSSTYTAAADNKVALNGDVGDARYGEIYVINLAADLSSNSTSQVTSNESVTLPAGAYTVTSYFYVDTASTSGGANSGYTNTVAPSWVSGRRSFFDSGTQSATTFSAFSSVRVATSVTGLGSACDAPQKTAMGESIAYFSLSAPSTIRFFISQRNATDGANPAILRARTIGVFRRIGN